jgi:hypothetical protein
VMMTRAPAARPRAGPVADGGTERTIACSWSQELAVIIASEPSAEAARRTARGDTHRCVATARRHTTTLRATRTAQPIRLHTNLLDPL